MISVLKAGLILFAVTPGLVLAELTTEERQMGLAIRTSLQEAGAAYNGGDHQMAGAKIQEVMFQLEEATANGSTDLINALIPMISQTEQAHALLVAKGVALPPFERPPGTSGSGGDPVADARYIDQLVAAKLKEEGLAPLPRSSDEVFLRRVYLDVAGRIPTYDEAEIFLEDSDPNKRAKLIDALMDSPAYVSHYLNYWTDILRIRDKLTKNSPGILYRDWVRKALMKNMPYDQFVRELIVARGYMWENPAAGFYIRDKNMPLDHLANAAQVFLGTQLQCAQCHDHPFDEWTQMDFYNLAAFTYGIQTDQKPISAKKLGGKFKGVTGESWYGFVKDYTTPLGSRARFDSKTQLVLPEDYQYGDGKPFDVVAPMTLFGEQAALEGEADPSAALADWMTSPENPRFALMIANRLWSQVMGAGIIEPIDDLSASRLASDGPLLEYLTQKIIDYRFDLKQYLRLVLHSEVYQRETYAVELQPGERSDFRGPLYRRMTAEQAWDSLMTLIVPDLDERYGEFELAERYRVAPGLLNRSDEELIPAFIEQRDRKQMLNQLEEMEHRLDRARRGKGNQSGPKKVEEIQEQIAELQQQIDSTPGLTALIREEERESSDPMDRELKEARKRAKENPIYFAFPKGARRASEIQMPAEQGHFLQEFGQSDRELIENSSTDASITQALALLNGPYFDDVLSGKSVLMTRVKDVERPEDKIRVIFLSVLTRPPSANEMSICRDAAEKHGEKGYQDIIWALLNTREFTFVN